MLLDFFYNLKSGFFALLKTAGAVFAALLVSLGLLSPPAPTYQSLEPWPIEEPTVSPSLLPETVSEKAPSPFSAPSEATVLENNPSTPPPVSSVSLPPLLPLGVLNTKARKSVVNIFCTTKRGGVLDPFSGSGVIIDRRGVILTNAHVAEYYLLEDYLTPGFFDCLIRTGSPAYPAYRAELLAISPTWIEANAATIKASTRTGTGENDYALLLITSRANGTPLSSEEENTFPALDPDVDFLPYVAHPVLLAGYPAEFLGGTIIVRDLYASSAEGMVERAYYINDPALTAPDVIGLGGTVLAQAGSSGGAVIDRYTGRLVALIVTTTEGTKTGDRALNGVTLSHINRAMALEYGLSLGGFLNQNLNRVLTLFKADEFTRLRDLLEREIEK